MKQRKLLFLALASLGCFVLSSCNKPDAGKGGGEAQGKPKITIGMTLPSSSHPFFVHLRKSVRDEADKLGVEIIGSDAEDVAAKQMSIVEDFIARGVDGVILAPIGADALLPAVEALNKAKIPVVTVDRSVSGGDVLVHVGADNVEGGRAAARYLIEKLGDKGEIIELEGLPGASAAIDRKKGFEEEIGKSGVKIAAAQTADFYRATGQTVMENLLQTHKDFQAVYAANDEMILGALEALEAKGIKGGDIVTIGFDALPEVVKLIEEGRITATVEQFPGQQGKTALDVLVEKIRDGKSPEAKEMYITPMVIDKDNLSVAEPKE